MVLGVKMAEIFEKKTRKMPLESVKIKISRIGLRYISSWLKLGMEAKFHEAGTFGGFEKREQSDRQTKFMFYKYRCGSVCSSALCYVYDVPILGEKMLKRLPWIYGFL